MSIDIASLVKRERNYVLHSHTQFCDGHADMSVMAEAAAKSGLRVYGFTPHSPVPVESPCNMRLEDVPAYLSEADRLRERYLPSMQILKSMEIDFLSPDFGPHIDYFQNLPLDYLLGSVHFVPTKEGVPVDCDGRYSRFEQNLKQAFGGDLRYVVEKYFEQVLTMLERGGFGLLGHFDKIAGNASSADPEIENQGWYEALIDDVISHAVSADVVVEINTKAIIDRKRHYPAQRWWRKIMEAGLPIAVNSDAHDPAKINIGRDETFRLLDSFQISEG